MSYVLEVKGLTKAYKEVTAVNDISFSLESNKIYGLLGRNGAGKTTMMHMITAQLFPTKGEIKVFGEIPFENNHVLPNICFIKESQSYPEFFRVSDVFATAADWFPHWDEAFAKQLANDFQLPLKRTIKKLSRGMLSSVGIVVGLASRAPLTIFDEPYLGLDAVARSIFYDKLLQDYAEYPRTILLSTHLIDEVSQLLDHILLIDRGKLIINDDLDSLRSCVYRVEGSSSEMGVFTKGKEVLHQENLGSIVSATIFENGNTNNRRQVEQMGLTYHAVSLQQLVIYLTTKSSGQVGEGQ